MHTFWEYGYTATSVDELLSAMNLSKSSFYQTFESKHKLMEKCLERYSSQIVDDMLSEFQSAESGLKFIEEILRKVAEKTDLGEGRRGCLVMNCAVEFAQRDAKFSQLVAESILQFRVVFLTGVKQAQKEGTISSHKDARVLADFLVSCKSGLETLAKAGTDKSSLLAMIPIMLSSLQA